MKTCRECEQKKATYTGYKLLNGKVLKKKIQICMDCLEVMMVRDDKGRYIYNDGFEIWWMEF